jgi:serine/threonine protein kinase
MSNVPTLKPGLEINGFTLEEEIGAGGMACVFRARQQSLDRTVAMKFMRPELADDNSGFAERFDREARLLARLSHPNLVSVYDRGAWEGHYYIVMEYVRGQNLLQLVRSIDLGPGHAMYLLSRIAQGIEFMHGNGVIHRDIKPSNILITLDGQVKVADFGLANIVAGEGDDLATAPDRLTETNMAMGTINYMAPEQALNAARVDRRADVYSLAVVAYYVLTRQIPVGDFPTPSAARPYLSAPVDAVIERGMARRPSDRYATALEFSRDLIAALRPAGVDIGLAIDSLADGSLPFWEKPDPILEAMGARGRSAPAVTTNLGAASRGGDRARAIPDSAPTELDATGRDLSRRPRPRTAGGLGFLTAMVATLALAAGGYYVFAVLPSRHVADAGDARIIGPPTPATPAPTPAPTASPTPSSTPMPLPSSTPTPTPPPEPEPTPAPQPTPQPTPDPRDQMVALPAGFATIGDDGGRFNAPAREVYLPAFLLDPTEVTNAQYAEFVAATGHPAPPHWGGSLPDRRQAGLPVVNVSFDDARAFAAWAGKRLPTAEEWAYAAGANDRRVFPWGDTRTHSANIGTAQVLPAEAARGDIVEWGGAEQAATGVARPSRLLHLAGNVAEWTDSPFVRPPGSPLGEATFPGSHVIVKGAAADIPLTDATGMIESARISSRIAAPTAPEFHADWIGFRCAADPQ